MHNFSPTSPVLGDPLQLFPSQPRLRDVCLKVTPPGVFRSPPLSLALGVPRQGLSRNVGVWLSQCVTKPSPSSLKKKKKKKKKKKTLFRDGNHVTFES